MSPRKLNILYQYYRDYGFDHTTEEMASKLNIGKKTFFNRYQTKEISIQMAVQYWYRIFQQRLQLKRLDCNHPVEELIIYLDEFRFVYDHEQVYYQFEMHRNRFLAPDAPFKSIFMEIINKGIRCYHFCENIDVAVYSEFLLFNVTSYYLVSSDKDIILKYLFSPLLTERGQTLFDEVNMQLLNNL